MMSTATPPFRSSLAQVGFALLTLIATALCWAYLYSGAPTIENSPTPLPARTPAAWIGPASQSTEVRPRQSLATQQPLRPPPRPLVVAPPPPPPPRVQPSPEPHQPQLPQTAYPTAQRLPTAVDSSQTMTATQYLKRAEQASQELARLIRQGKVRVQFVGTGHSGGMVEVALENLQSKALTIRLVPGMMLKPPDGQKVQPLMLDEEVTLDLAPGTSAYRTLRSYCLDSRVPAPASMESVDYQFSPRAREAGPAQVVVFQAAQELSLEPCPLPESLHRQAVTQIALWKSMGQPVDDSRMISAMGPAFYDEDVRRLILREVEQVLQKARVSHRQAY